MSAATDRLEMRLGKAEKSLLTRAAALAGVKLSQFILTLALKQARKLIAESESVATTARGYRDVLDALANPPKPTQALITAMQGYEKAGIQWR